MTDIQLNVINQSNDTNNTEYVIFQQNEHTVPNETAIAWTVIKNLGIGDTHLVTYPQASKIGATDSFGNFYAHACSYAWRTV